MNVRVKAKIQTSQLNIVLNGIITQISNNNHRKDINKLEHFKDIVSLEN